MRRAATLNCALLGRQPKIVFEGFGLRIARIGYKQLVTIIPTGRGALRATSRPVILNISQMRLLEIAIKWFTKGFTVRQALYGPSSLS
ncbi:hypothetical protein KY284_013039 [Solanum tuberosum]|nr:hypothetical protein KY284_013039 [Solanum tuberosum]